MKNWGVLTWGDTGMRGKFQKSCFLRGDSVYHWSKKYLGTVEMVRTLLATTPPNEPFQKVELCGSGNLTAGEKYCDERMPSYQCCQTQLEKPLSLQQEIDKDTDKKSKS